METVFAWNTPVPSTVPVHFGYRDFTIQHPHLHLTSEPHAWHPMAWSWVMWGDSHRGIPIADCFFFSGKVLSRNGWGLGVPPFLESSRLGSMCFNCREIYHDLSSFAPFAKLWSCSLKLSSCNGQRSVKDNSSIGTLTWWGWIWVESLSTQITR